MSACPICKKKSLRGDKSLCCSICNNTYHCVCIEMQPADYDFFKEKNMLWKCANCLTSARSSIENKILSPSVSHKSSHKSSNASPLYNLNDHTSNPDKDFDCVNKKLNDLSNHLQETKRVLLDKFATMEENLISTINALKHENDSLKLEVNKLHSRINDLEQSALNNCIDIIGFPHFNDNNALLDSLLKFFSNTLNTNISTENVVFCYQKKNPNSSNIELNSITHIKFDTSSNKNIVMRAKKELYRNKTSIDFLNLTSVEVERKIFINDSLTKQNRILFNSARHFKEKNNVKFLWIKNGKILMREKAGSKVKLIESTEDLNSFFINQVSNTYTNTNDINNE